MYSSHCSWSHSEVRGESYLRQWTLAVFRRYAFPLFLSKAFQESRFNRFESRLGQTRFDFR